MEEEKKSKAKIISDAICGIVMLLCVISYVIVGLFAQIWHPTWIILVGGAVFCGILSIICSTITGIKEVNEKENKNK